LIPALATPSLPISRRTEAGAKSTSSTRPVAARWYWNFCTSELALPSASA